MRIAFHRQMAPRGAHPPDAKFLKGKPLDHSIRLTQDFQASCSHYKQHSSQPFIEQKLQNASSITSSSSSPTNKLRKNEPVVHDKIPSTLNSLSSTKPAPKKQIQSTLSTSEFNMVLRKKSLRSKKTVLSPKSYYKSAIPTNSKESSKESAFIQYSKLVDNVGNPPTMTEETPTNTPVLPNVTPEKDSEMKNGYVDPPLTDAETTAIMEEFDASTNEPPVKLSKTHNQGVDLTNTGSTPTNHHSPKSNAPPVPNGTNIGMFTSIQESSAAPPVNVNKAPSIAAQNASAHKIAVNHVVKNIFTCRFKLSIKGQSCNLPHMAKQATKLFRSVDPSLHILPFNGVTENNKVLDTEENLPHDEITLKTWVVESSIQKDRLHFTMKYSTIKEVGALSKKIFPWMKANKSFVKIDKIDSEKISCLGLFEGLHPDFRNRDTFKQNCLQHIKKYNPTITPEISIYPRSVYAGAGLEKVESRAVVIEVAVEEADYILQALSHTFSDEYSDVTFVPFTKTDETYSSILRQVMIQQNTMLHSTKRKILHGLRNIDEFFTMKDGTSMSVRKWLLSAKSEETSDTSPIIQHVDFTTNNSVTILFNKKHEILIHTLLRDIEEELLKYFNANDVAQVYDSSKAVALNPVNARVITDSERLWAEVIKRKYAVNPQSDTNDYCSPPNKNRKVLYHGPSTPPDQLQDNSFDQSPTSSQQSLEHRITQLEEQAKTNNEKQKTFIQTTIQSTMLATETKIVLQTNEKYEDLANKMQKLETTTFSTLEKFSNNMTVLSSNVEKLCNSLLPKSTTNDGKNPSEGGKNQ